jgi:hypothetical protein
VIHGRVIHNQNLQVWPRAACIFQLLFWFNDLQEATSGEDPAAMQQHQI